MSVGRKKYVTGYEERKGWVCVSINKKTGVLRTWQKKTKGEGKDCDNGHGASRAGDDMRGSLLACPRDPESQIRASMAGYSCPS